MQSKLIRTELCVIARCKIHSLKAADFVLIFAPKPFSARERVRKHTQMNRRISQQFQIEGKIFLNNAMALAAFRINSPAWLSANKDDEISGCVGIIIAACDSAQRRI